MPSKRNLLRSAFSLVLACAMCSAHAANPSPDEWPSKVVKIEDLRAQTSFELQVPSLVVKGQVTGPAILRVHIATDGSVVRTVLLASCGNADLDEASMHATRHMRFAPYTEDSTPIEVTLVLPVHVPKRFGRKE